MSSAQSTARDYVDSFALGGGAFALFPLPGQSVALTVAEAKMAAGIARIYGLNPYGVIWTSILKIIMLKFGGSMLLKAASEALTFIPIIGWAAKGIIASATIKGFGELLINYFENKFPAQTAYSKPSLSSMVMAFGDTIAKDSLKDYLSSYNNSR